MSMQKRALPSSSSGQSSQPKRPCFALIGEESNGRSLLTMEDLRAMIREELQHAKSEIVRDCQSVVRNAVEKIVQKMQSTENASKKLKEAVEPANIYTDHLGRANAKSTAKNDTRNLQLQFQTKLSLPLFTENKLEGEGGAQIHVALMDAKAGRIFTSGPESSIKLDVVVLEGDFNKDNEENWTHEEFENYRAKEREGKGPLLTGNLKVTLKEGVGKLGELKFTDGSRFNRSGSFRLGLMVASGYCGYTRIQEGITDAFPVKTKRGELNMKHYPPASGDEVWRLQRIANGGKSHQKLSEAGIHRVEDFLLQLFTDPQKLKEILGKSITAKNWDVLVNHAKTCKTNWKLYLYHSDGMRKRDVVFNTDGQLIGLIKDRVFFATHRLPAQEKAHGDAIMKKALGNWKYVKDFGGETFSDSMQKNRAYSSQVFDEQIEKSNPVQRYLAPSAPVGLEAPLANVGSTAEGINGPMALALPEQSQNTNSGNSMEISVDEPFHLAAHQPMPADHLNVPIPPGYHGSTTAGWSTQSQGINLQNAMHGPMIDSSSQMDHTGYADVLPSEQFYASISSSLSRGTLPPPQGNCVTEVLPPIDEDDTLEKWLLDNPSFFNGVVRGPNRGVIGWLKIKAVLQWGYFIRKRRATIEPWDKFSVEVQACS